MIAIFSLNLGGLLLAFTNCLDDGILEAEYARGRKSLVS